MSQPNPQVQQTQPPAAEAEPPPEHLARDFADRSIKGVLSHRTLLDQLLKNALPTDVYDHLDCAKAKPEKTDFIDPRWRKRFADVFWLIPWGKGEDGQAPKVLVGVLIEHQSQPDGLMPLRMLIYVVRYWERELKIWEDRESPKPPFRPCVAIPLIFYTNNRTWKGPRRLRELLQAPELLEKHVPDWESIFWCLRDYEVQELKDSEDELLQALAVPRAERMKFETFREAVRNAAEKILKSTRLKKADRRGLLDLILNWMQHRRTKKEFDRLTQELEPMFINSPESLEMLKTYKNSAAAHFQKAAFDQGEKTGYEKGEMKGELRANRKTLSRLLERKFGSLTAEIQGRIEQCGQVTRLETAIDQVAVMQSLDELAL